MIRLILSLILCLSFSNIFAQVAAGVSGNLFVNNNNQIETVNLSTVPPPFGQSDNETTDSLDLNRDGLYDVKMYGGTCNTFDCSGGSTSVSSMHPKLEWMTDGNNNIRKLAVGDSINKNQNWAVVDHSTLIYKIYGIGGYIQAGNWFPEPDGYAGVRLTEGQDTLYGWLSITATVQQTSGSTNIKVLQWAIEKSTTVYQNVIAGNPNGLMPCSNSFQLNIGPPTLPGMDSIRADTFDINGDGVSDAALVVAVCNTGGCLKSSVYLSGLHSGFNFVRGQNGVKRFQDGEIIGVYSNWDTLSPDLHSGYLLSTGSDANGNQTFGEWLNNSTGFAGIRLVTPNADTLLGWIYMKALAMPGYYASVLVYGCAIQHDPSQLPYITVTVAPQKNVYCPGDTVVFQAVAVGATQYAWHFWDGATDTVLTVTKVLPDSSVTATFEAINANGPTVWTAELDVSPLAIEVEDILLTCYQPVDTLSASTNIPAEIWWVVGNDTIYGPTPPPIIFPGLYITVFAQDEYGCVVSEQVVIEQDVTVPDVSIEYDETNHILIAHSGTPNVTFTWYGGPSTWPVMEDTVSISLSGTYTLVATAPNGCTSSASITVVITATEEPFSGSVLILPNPASEVLRIRNRLPADIDLKIFNAAGGLELAHSTAPANSITELDVALLPGGFYLLGGFDPEGKPLFFKKFVKK